MGTLTFPRAGAAAVRLPRTEPRDPEPAEVDEAILRAAFAASGRADPDADVLATRINGLCVRFSGGRILKLAPVPLPPPNEPAIWQG